MPIFIEGEQGTDEWVKRRLGVVSASRMDEILTTKGEPSKTRTKYIRDLAGEIITGEPKFTQKYGSMQKGNDREEEARRFYSFQTGYEIKQYQFVFMDESRRIGCSPDGIIEPKGGFETKNAEPHVQLERLECGMSKALHFQQVQSGLWICEREWWDLQSYCRNMPNIVIRYHRDEKFIERMASEVKAFVEELDVMVKKYSL